MIHACTRRSSCINTPVHGGVAVYKHTCKGKSSCINTPVQGRVAVYTNLYKEE